MNRSEANGCDGVRCRATAAPDEAGLRRADGMGGRISRRSGSSASRIGVAADSGAAGTARCAASLAVRMASPTGSPSDRTD